MFNRNINPRQFSFDDEPAPSGPPTFPRRASGEEHPLAGGSMRFAEPVEGDHAAMTKFTPATWISQSAQTVLPGTGRLVRGNPIFFAHDEDEEGDWKAPMSIGQMDYDAERNQAAVTLASTTDGGAGADIQTTRIVPNEDVGQTIRDYQAARKDERNRDHRGPGVF